MPDFAFDQLLFDRLIYGGSFDPPHRGHQAIIAHVLQKNLAGALEIVPAAVSPFKQDAPPTSGADRLALVEAAIQDFAVDSNANGLNAEALARVRVNTIELDRPPPSYTADTCRALRERYPDERIGLLIGSDSLREFHLWTRVSAILAAHPVCVFRRGTESDAEIEALCDGLRARFAGAEFLVLDNPLVDCASSDLRTRMANADSDGETEHPCLSPRVQAAIHARGLYRLS